VLTSMGYFIQPQSSTAKVALSDEDLQTNKLSVSFGVPLAMPVLNRCVHVAERTLAKPVARATHKDFPTVP